MTLVPSAVWIRRSALAALWGVALLGLVLFRSHQAGSDAMRRSDDAFDRGQLGEALSAASEASAWYFPFAPHVVRAHERLRAIAMGAESTGNRALALRAYGAIRSALISTAHPGARGGPLLEQADAGILRTLPKADDETSGMGHQQLTLPKPIFHAATTCATVLMLLAGSLLITRRELSVLSVAVALGGCGLFLWVFAALGA